MSTLRPSTITLNPAALFRMREDFLQTVPDFADFTERSGHYWHEEREYKDETCDVTHSVLTPELFADDSAANAPNVLADVKRVLLGTLRGWCPRDMIDVHCFLWMTARSSDDGSKPSFQERN